MLKDLWPLNTRIQLKDSLHLTRPSKTVKQPKQKQAHTKHPLVEGMCLVLTAERHLHDHITVMFCAVCKFQK